MDSPKNSRFLYAGRAQRGPAARHTHARTSIIDSSAKAASLLQRNWVDSAAGATFSFPLDSPERLRFLYAGRAQRGPAAGRVTRQDLGLTRGAFHQCLAKRAEFPVATGRGKAPMHLPPSVFLCMVSLPSLISLTRTMSRSCARLCRENEGPRPPGSSLPPTPHADPPIPSSLIHPHPEPPPHPFGRRCLQARRTRTSGPESQHIPSRTPEQLDEVAAQPCRGCRPRPPPLKPAL